MRILAISNLYPPEVMGGYELGCSQVVDGLRSNGHDVQVLTAVPRLPLSGPDPAHVLRRLQLVEDRYWTHPDGSPDDVFFFLRDAGSRFINAHNVHILTETLDDFRPDVVYVNNLVGLGGLGLLASLQFMQVPRVWHLGDAIPMDLCCGGRDLLKPLVSEFNRAEGGHYIAVSRRLVEEIRSVGIRLDGALSLLPYWITGTRDDRVGLRARVAGGPLRIMSCGVVNRQKGVDILIEAAARLLNDGFDGFHVDIYGRIDDSTLPALANSLGLTGHVTFHGPQPHSRILRHYADYDVFAFPTQMREPFGIVPLEALASGCVPLMTSRCGVAEWLVHGVHCLKAARHAESFAEVFRAILRREIDLAPIADRGRDLVWKHFHLDAILPKIEGVLESAASQKGRMPGSAAEAYRLARLAEALAQNLIRQTMCA